MSYAALVTTPWLRDMKVGQTTLGEAFDENIAIGILHSEGVSFAQRKLVPQSLAAAKLFRGPKNDSAEGVVRKMLSLLDDHPGVKELDGVTLNTSPEGLTASALLAQIDAGFIPLPSSEVDAAQLQQWRGWVESLYSQYASDASGLASQNLRWVDLGLVPSAVIDARIAGRKLGGDSATLGTATAETLDHELLHSVFPPPLVRKSTPGAAAIFDLDELSRETLARWAGRSETVASRLDLEHTPDELLSAYPDLLDSGRRLAKWAGLDPNDAALWPRALELFAGAPAEAKAEHIAQRIAAVHTLSSVQETKIATALKDGQFSSRQLNELGIALNLG